MTVIVCKRCARGVPISSPVKVKTREKVVIGWPYLWTAVNSGKHSPWQTERVWSEKMNADGEEIGDYSEMHKFRIK